MNIRDYWISKLPTIRNQSPSTGKLVESLLINDSKVSRNILLEIAKLYKSVNKLQEDAETKEDIRNRYKGQMFDKIVGTKKEEIESFIYNSKSLLQDINLKGENFLKLEVLCELAEEKLNKINSSKTRKLSNTFISFYKKIIKELNKLYINTGLKKVWDNINGIIKYTTETAAVVSIIVISLIFAIYIKREHESIGESILVFIVSILILSLSVNLVFSLKQFFIDIYNMIVKLINMIKNKFKNKVTI